MTSIQSVLLLFMVQLSFLQIYGQQSKKFFRKDYTYLSDTESFYKIHTIHRTWQEAKKRCAMEGASLFYPEDLKEADTVISFWNQTQPFFFVYVGVSNMLAKEVFQTYDDGRSILDIYNTWAPGEPNDANGNEGCVVLRKDGLLNDERYDKKFPFICKKTLQTLQWNVNCDMPNDDYKFESAQGRCYKFHLDPKTWSEALATCDAEQSYLAVVNTQSEADHLVKITEQAPKDKVKAKHFSGVIYLGFHHLDGEDWKTIKGTGVICSFEDCRSEVRWCEKLFDCLIRSKTCTLWLQQLGRRATRWRREGTMRQYVLQRATQRYGLSDQMLLHL